MAEKSAELKIRHKQILDTMESGREYSSDEVAEQKVQSLIEAKQEAMRNKPNLKPWIETFRKYQNIEKLDRSVVVSLIDRIIASRYCIKSRLYQPSPIIGVP